MLKSYFKPIWDCAISISQGIYLPVLPHFCENILPCHLPHLHYENDFFKRICSVEIQKTSNTTSKKIHQLVFWNSILWNKIYNRGILETPQVLHTNFLILKEQCDIPLIRDWKNNIRDCFMDHIMRSIN